MDEETRKKIEEMINEKKVFLMMKGTPEQPMCGFSKRVVDILNTLEVEFSYFNVFDDPDLMNAIKAYSNWPTTPQLYIDGKFVGGCDITMEMYASGELHKLLGKEKKDPTAFGAQ